VNKKNFLIVGLLCSISFIFAHELSDSQTLPLFASENSTDSENYYEQALHKYACDMAKRIIAGENILDAFNKIPDQFSEDKKAIHNLLINEMQSIENAAERKEYGDIRVTRSQLEEDEDALTNNNKLTELEKAQAFVSSHHIKFIGGALVIGYLMGNSASTADDIAEATAAKFIVRGFVTTTER